MFCCGHPHIVIGLTKIIGKTNETSFDDNANEEIGCQCLMIVNYCGAPFVIELCQRGTLSEISLSLSTAQVTIRDQN